MDLLALLNLQPNDRVLELECGSGGLGAAMAALTLRGLVVAMDSSDDRVREARARAATLDNLMFIPGGAAEIPWKEGFFSLVVSHAVPEPATDVYRVLEPGGRLVVVLESRAAAEQLAARLAAQGWESASIRDLDAGRAALITHKQPQ